MADKPRVKAPKQRSAQSRTADDRRKQLLTVGGAAVAAAVVVGLLVAMLALGGGGPNEDEVRAALTDAGCSFEAVDARPGQHSIRDPGGTSDDWNTDPPTNGAHFGIAAIFGIYEEPLEQARVVHNLEHGGVFIQYGEDVDDATVDQLRSFYEDHKTGTIMAPLAELGDEFALGAWVHEGDIDKGYLARCSAFDEEAVSVFFDGFQFKGPERFRPEDLRPGQ